EAARLVAERIQDLDARTKATALELDRGSETFVRRGQDLAANAEQGAARLARLSELFRQRAQDIAGKADDILARMGANTGALRGQLHELASQYTSTERSVANLGETLVLRAEEIGGMSRQALDQVSAWTQVARSAETTAANAERVSDQARQIGEGLQRQVTDMREATREAQDVLRILNERRRQAGTQEFLRDATFVMERLQSLAIDMNRVLETELSEDDWQRYSKGEKGLFVRKMLGMRERSRLAAVAQHYREDSEFREYVNRYIAQFETTLGEAKKRDMDGVLATTFLTADIGKVYMLLIRAIGRET
ncbi:MAG: hypothetical protein AAB223_03610, partial [Pseudomonadota bacterium]